MTLATTAPTGPRNHATPHGPRIAVHRLGVHFGRTIALHGVSFEARRAERLAVIGPNGAGKSTLLACLATLLTPQDGRITHDGALDGRAHRHTLRGRIGLVAHDVLVYAELTARENLELYAGLHGRGPEAVDHWLDRVGLASAAHRAVGGFSRGMKQRLALARALVHEPDLVLLDEPLTGLDRQGQAFLWELLDELQAKQVLVLLVTHHLETSAEQFSRVLTIARGRLRHDAPATGTLADVYARATGGNR